MLLCGLRNNTFSSLVLTTLRKKMFFTTAMKCLAVPDQGNASLMFAILTDSKEGSTELQIWKPGSSHLSLSNKRDILQKVKWFL